MLFIELILYWTWYFSWISALISHNSQQNQVDDVGMFSGSCVLSGFITCYLNLLHDWSICEKSVRWLTTITSSSWHDKICWSVWWKENFVYSMLSGSDHMQSNREFRCHTVLMTVKTTQIFISLSVISQNMQNKHQLSVTFSFTQQLL